MARRPPRIGLIPLCVVVPYGAVAVGIAHLAGLPLARSMSGWLGWAGSGTAFAGILLILHSIHHLSMRRAVDAKIFAPGDESAVATS